MSGQATCIFRVALSEVHLVATLTTREQWRVVNGCGARAVGVGSQFDGALGGGAHLGEQADGQEQSSLKHFDLMIIIH